MRRKVLAMMVALVALAVSPARADVHLTIAEGRVTISAKDATIRQILAEWARVGQTRIVNAERVSGAPVSIELADVPESQALDTILRSVSGYLAAPRAVPSASTSTYDRIFLLPTSSGAAARATAGSPQGQQGFQQTPVFTPPQQPDFPDDEVDRQPGPPPGVVPPNSPRGPAFATFPPPAQFPQQRQVPQRQQQQQPQPAAPAPPPTSFGTPPAGVVAPVGVTTPGMLVPTPQPQQDPDANPR